MLQGLNVPPIVRSPNLNTEVGPHQIWEQRDKHHLGPTDYTGILWLCVCAWPCKAQHPAGSKVYREGADAKLGFHPTWWSSCVTWPTCSQGLVRPAVVLHSHYTSLTVILVGLGEAAPGNGATHHHTPVRLLLVSLPYLTPTLASPHLGNSFCSTDCNVVSFNINDN